jgi:hypothetical protein
LQVDVEDRAIVSLGLRKGTALLDTARLRNDLVPEFLDHLNKHHPNEDLVFDKEYGCLAHLASPYVFDPVGDCALRKRETAVTSWADANGELENL